MSFLGSRCLSILAFAARMSGHGVATILGHAQQVAVACSSSLSLQRTSSESRFRHAKLWQQALRNNQRLAAATDPFAICTPPPLNKATSGISILSVLQRSNVGTPPRIPRNVQDDRPLTPSPLTRRINSIVPHQPHHHLPSTLPCIKSRLKTRPGTMAQTISSHRL